MKKAMIVDEKIARVREEMENAGMDAFIVPVTDPHQGEYMPERYRSIAWLTGFTGSAGTVVITRDFAGLWTDSRYFIQAEQQLRDSPVSLVKLKVSHTPEYIEWITETLPGSSRVGVDGKVVSVSLVRQIKESFSHVGISLDTEHDIVNMIWNDRPEIPENKAFEHDVQYAGVARKDKLQIIREQMQRKKVTHHLLTALDDIAWTFNIRGTDVRYNPLVTAYSVISETFASLFIDRKKLPEQLTQKLIDDGLEIKPYDEIMKFLSGLDPNDVMMISPGSTSFSLFNSIPEKVKVVEDISIPNRIKAIKNDIEIDHIRNVMVKDGVALTKFFFWLEQNLGKERITEISASKKLETFRREQENFVHPSFATIAGYGPHGAIVHYEATPESDVELKQEGLFLLDSGGHYLDGTTDITRTNALGQPTAKQKRDFTLALQGTINLARIEFPEGTKGYQIEILARKALWENGLNYGHGTGHGVGFFLNVHEGPQTIGTGASGNAQVPMEPGMLTADEPGIYREGEYGIRTENLILCVPSKETEFGKFLKFETVTLCFIDTDLVDKSLLNKKEIKWLNDYHQKVFEKLSPFLEEDEKKWLEGKCKRREGEEEKMRKCEDEKM